MDIDIKRVYEKAGVTDGCRVLVDRLWPRGLSKDKARIDYWAKEIAPSTELRKKFAHDTDRWEDFKKNYHQELRKQRLPVERLFTKYQPLRQTYPALRRA